MTRLRWFLFGRRDGAILRPVYRLRSKLAQALLPDDRLAFAFWTWVFIRGDSIDSLTMAHEAVHVEQFGRLGVVGFFWRYWRWAGDYEHNPLEVEARRRSFAKVYGARPEDWA